MLLVYNCKYATASFSASFNRCANAPKAEFNLNEFLFEKKPDFDLADERGLSALSEICKNKDFEIIRKIKEYGKTVTIGHGRGSGFGMKILLKSKKKRF